MASFYMSPCNRRVCANTSVRINCQTLKILDNLSCSKFSLHKFFKKYLHTYINVDYALSFSNLHYVGNLHK